MLNTYVRPSRDLRNNYAEMIKTLKEHDHIVITNKGVGEAVLIGIENFAKYEEYLHHRFIYDELQKSKVRANDPDTVFISSQTMFANITKRLESRSL